MKRQRLRPDRRPRPKPCGSSGPARGAAASTSPAIGRRPRRSTPARSRCGPANLRTSASPAPAWPSATRHFGSTVRPRRRHSGPRGRPAVRGHRHAGGRTRKAPPLPGSASLPGSRPAPAAHARRPDRASNRDSRARCRPSPGGGLRRAGFVPSTSARPKSRPPPGASRPGPSGPYRPKCWRRPVARRC